MLVPTRGALRTILALTCLSVLPPALARAGDCTVTLSPGADLQRAIDGAPVDGRRVVVCLTAGEFPLAGAVTIARDRVTLRGVGPETVLHLDRESESPVVVVGDDQSRVPRHPTTDVRIESLRIVGQGRRGSELDREHPYVTNSAVVIRTGQNVVLRALDVTECRSACLLTEYDSRDVVIEGNRIDASVWDGISLNRTSKARVVGNVVRANTAAGITAEHLERSVIKDNRIMRNGTHGLYLSDSYDNVVTANRFAANVLSGVFLTCAVRYHKPLAQCWTDSMSRGNVFVRNEFVDNRVGFTVAADGAASCTPGVVSNRSRGDLFTGNASEEPDWTAVGRCLRYEQAAFASPVVSPSANVGALRDSAPRRAPSHG